MEQLPFIFTVSLRRLRPVNLIGPFEAAT